MTETPINIAKIVTIRMSLSLSSPEGDLAALDEKELCDAEAELVALLVPVTEYSAPLLALAPSEAVAVSLLELGT